jgi:hypothetical protein
MIGQDASTLATEYGPQWMNIPNFASRYHPVLSSALAGTAQQANNTLAAMIRGLREKIMHVALV